MPTNDREMPPTAYDKDVQTHTSLGTAPAAQGDVDEAIAGVEIVIGLYRMALRRETAKGDETAKKAIERNIKHFETLISAAKPHSAQNAYTVGVDENEARTAWPNPHDQSAWNLEDAVSWAKNQTLYQLGISGKKASAHAIQMLIEHATMTKTPTPSKE